MSNIFMKIIKIIIKSSSPNIVIFRVLAILLNSILSPIITLLLGKIALYLTNKDKMNLVFYLMIYIFVCFGGKILSRYIGIQSQKSNDKMVLGLREYMIDLQKKIPNDIIESPSYIRLRERVDVFLNTYALRYLSCTERLITIGLTVASYFVIFWKINFYILWYNIIFVFVHKAPPSEDIYVFYHIYILIAIKKEEFHIQFLFLT